MKHCRSTWDTDEKSCENQESCEVHRDNSFKEELFEIVRAVDNDHDEERGNIDCQNGINDTPLQNNFHHNPFMTVT